MSSQANEVEDFLGFDTCRLEWSQLSTVCTAYLDLDHFSRARNLWQTNKPDQVIFMGFGGLKKKGDTVLNYCFRLSMKKEINLIVELKNQGIVS